MQFLESSAEKVADWLSSVGNLKFAMPSQAVAGRTVVGMSHPVLALNRGEIWLNEKIFRNGQRAKRRGADGYRCNWRKGRLHSGGERRGLVYSHLYTPRRKRGPLESKRVQEATVRMLRNGPEMALLTEGEEICPKGRKRVGERIESKIYRLHTNLCI